jgi:GAF domain-containing protein
MRSTGKLAAGSDRLRARVEALERLAAESRLAAEARDGGEARDEPALVELEALTAVARVAAEAKEPAVVLTSVEQALARALDVRTVRVLLVGEDGVLTRLLPAGDSGGVEPATQSAAVARRVLERQTPLRTSACPDAAGPGAAASPALAPEEPHTLWVPLLASGQAVGVIEVRRRTRPFSGAEEHLVTTLGGLLALALRAISPSAR